MRLWIRSQNKERLEEVSLLYLAKSDNGYYEIKGNFCSLGEYTKERALEILDKIQNILILKKLSELNGKNFAQGMTSTEELRTVVNSMTVFEMPE